MSPDSAQPKTQANPATDAHAPRQAIPVMDVVPPPAAPASAQPAAEDPGLAVSPEVAAQLESDAAPAVPAATTESSATPDKTADNSDSGVEPAPPDDAQDGQPDSPNDIIAQEIKREHDTPQSAAPKAPGQSNGVALAITATVIIILVLAGLTVFAYLSTQK